MGFSRKQTAEFLQRHFTTKPTRRQLTNISTVFIDTANLTSGQLKFDRVISLDPGVNALRIATTALIGQKTPLRDALTAEYPAPIDTKTPLRICNDAVQGSIWHHGQAFLGFWVGKPTSIVHHADLTENEREALLLQSRQLAAHGSIVFAVSYSEQNTEPKTYSDTRSRIAGLIVLHPTLYPGTESTVADMHAHGLRIIYASSDREHDVQVFARACCLLTGKLVPFVWRPGRELPTDHIVYAGLDTVAYKKLLSMYPAETRITAKDPLPLFWKQFSHLL